MERALWRGSGEKILCENEGILNENAPIYLNKPTGQSIFSFTSVWPEGMVKIWQQIWGHAFRGGDAAQKGGTRLKMGTHSEEQQLLSHLCPRGMGLAGRQEV